MKQGAALNNICFVVTSPFTVNGFLVNHLKALSRNRRVTLCTNLDLYPLSPELKQLQLRIIDIPLERKVSFLNDLATLWTLYWIFRQNRFDSVHSITPKAGLLGMTAALFAQVPLRFHTFTGQIWVTSKGLKRSFYKRVDTLIALLTSKVFADSASQIQLLIKEGIVSKDEISLLGTGSISGVDLERFKIDSQVRTQIRKQYGAQDSTCVFLFVGRLCKDKGVLDLILAYAFLFKQQSNQDSALWIVGPDEEDIRSQAEKLPDIPWQQIRWMGASFEPELFMTSADVLMLPSYREGFGSVIIEAAACSLPALAYQIDGVIDAVDDLGTGILSKTGDITALSLNMQKLIHDPTYRQRLGKQASERAHEHFSSKAITQAWVDFYEHEKVTSNTKFLYSCSKRVFDLLLAVIAGLILMLPMLLVAIVIKLTSSGPVLYWAQRVGKDNRLFMMPKFRSMKIGTPVLATHLLENPTAHLTPIGLFLRKSSLDELPQLWCILTGSMSFVGPRPALFNQEDLIALRNEYGVDTLVPGLTGWAQVNGRDEIAIHEKVKLDAQYLENRSLLLDLKILWMTFMKVIRHENISH
jgi:lipopolysaccharide/colanic/teichoic acid biosynthesis glycosyltransferase